MNKLKENIENELSEIAIENNLSEKCELISNNIEQITDDFSIKFVEWCDNNTTQSSKGEWVNWLPNAKNTFTTTELQQYFKENVYNK